MIVKDGKDNTASEVMKTGYAPVPDRVPFHSNDSYGQGLPQTPPPPAYGAVHASIYRPRVRNVSATRRRFWHFFAVAVVFWVVSALFVRTIDLHGIHSKQGDVVRSYPEFESGEALRCTEGPHWRTTSAEFFPETTIFDGHRPPYHASTTFSLPIDADLLYFVSRGSLADGSVLIDMASESSTGDATVKVDVNVWYWVPDGLERASVCALERHENGDQYGVGIFTPRSTPGGSGGEWRLHFEVAIHLPLGIYKALETDYGNFALKAGDLQGNIAFEKIHLRTSNGPVHAESLEALKGTVKSSNGPISGRYNVTNSLELVTSNAGIDTTIDMYNEAPNVTSLLLKTSNGHIRTNLSLHGQPYASAFDSQVRTSNAPAIVSVVSQPHTVPLTLDVRTSNSPARVALHPAFEGPFTLWTSSFVPPILRSDGNEMEDPSGKGRDRTVEASRPSRGTLDGKVWWGEWTTRGKGWVHITSSNSPVELDLTGTSSW